MAETATTSGAGLLYCHRCDLTFCARHLAAHPGGEGHDLVYEPTATFCSVCAGIYRPQEPERV